MLKRIPKSDISIRPFKAYKEWTFDDTSFPASSSLEINERLALYDANFNIPDTEYVTMSYSSSDYPTGNIYKYYPRSIYGQLRAQFYNGQEDNPFTRLGSKTNVYNDDELTKERYLGTSAKVLSIPQIYVGEGIKKGSVYFLDNNVDPYIDDANGNLVSQTGLSQIDFSTLDLSGSTFSFDSAGDTFNSLIDAPLIDAASPWFVDVEAGKIEFVINGELETADISSIDIQTGTIFVKNSTFLPSLTIGNVFYNQGLIVFTRNLNLILSNDWDLSFKSTKTIYENEYLLIVNQDEFNVSTNPSAIVNVGRETEFVTGSDGKIQQVVKTPGVNYIRQLTELPNGDTLDYRFTGSVGNKKGGFEQVYTMGSIDSTGSFLTPMITTIGLYDDDCQLVAVAKLPQPIKSESDMPVNFIVRFDT
jgi:hypothetical protein